MANRAHSPASQAGRNSCVPKCNPPSLTCAVQRTTDQIEADNDLEAAFHILTPIGYAAFNRSEGYIAEAGEASPKLRNRLGYLLSLYNNLEFGRTQQTKPRESREEEPPAKSVHVFEEDDSTDAEETDDDDDHYPDFDEEFDVRYEDEIWLRKQAANLRRSRERAAEYLREARENLMREIARRDFEYSSQTQRSASREEESREDEGHAEEDREEEISKEESDEEEGCEEETEHELRVETEYPQVSSD